MEQDRVLAFLDFEFNCPNQKGSSKREIISMAAVFKKNDGSLLTTFYSIVKPSRNQVLSQRTIKLTGITQNQVDKSPTFDKVIDDFLVICNALNPEKYFVWGTADKVEVQKSLRYAKGSKEMRIISEKFHDLQVNLTRDLQLITPYNLERIARIYEIEFTHTFSALNDAECLADVYFAYKNGSPNNNLLDLYKEYYRCRSLIGRYKLIQNNIKMSELKIQNLEMDLKQAENEMSKKSIKQHIAETRVHISQQRTVLKNLESSKFLAERFLIKNDI